MSFKVYGDGNVIYHATISTSGDAFSVTGSTPSFSATSISDTMVRLPASVHTKFAIEILADKVVNEVCIGENIAELKEA